MGSYSYVGPSRFLCKVGPSKDCLRAKFELSSTSTGFRIKLAPKHIFDFFAISRVPNIPPRGGRLSRD